MAAHSYRAISVLLAFCFAIIALVFGLLAITSSKWVARDYFNSPVPQDWLSPNLTIYRSPFRICTASPVFQQDGNGDKVFHNYTWDCHRYRPSGVSKTSCEVPAILEKYFKSTDKDTKGDQRLCQQIHYAGDFGISGVFFISLGSLMTIGLMAIAAFLLVSQKRESAEVPSNADPDAGQSHDRAMASKSARESGSTNTRRNRLDRYHAFSTLNFVTVTFLCIGSILALIAQFYGVTGLVQSSPNNSDFASSAAGTAAGEDGNIYGYHGPWYQSDGLSVYMTCAWAFAVLTATMGARTWRMPRLHEKL